MTDADDGPPTEILDGTYRALSEHGYADLTLNDIAAESDRSKSLIHYYFDSKDELIDTFLRYLYDRYTDHVNETAAGETNWKQLTSLLERLFDEDESEQQFRTVLLEVKAQAPYNEPIRERLVEFDAALFERLEAIITAGIESGEFDTSVDPDRAAECLTATIHGAHARQVAIHQSTDRVYETVVEYVGIHLAADGNQQVTH